MTHKHISRFGAATAALVLAAGLVPPACARDEAAVQTAPVTVTLDKTTKTYRIDWPETLGTSVTVEVSPAPGTPAGEGTVIATDPEVTEISWTADSLAERHYFTLVPATGEPVHTALRLLPLEGGRNFRDLGGYRTENGQSVKWGKVYRSGVMDELTDADYDYLSSLGIKVVCDLRTARERSDEPTDWNAGEIEYLTFPDPAEGEDQSSFMAVFRNPDASPEMVSQAMADGYADIAHEQAPAYREMFDQLAAGDIPLAFNCSAGKDRTGIAAALLLTALGVPRETVVADYALSETYVDYMEEFAGDEAALDEDSPYAFLAQLPPEMVAPLMRSDPVYIETAFADLEEEYGSVMAFLKEEIDVTEEELATIRSQLLH